MSSPEAREAIYERLRGRISEAGSSQSPDARDVLWCTESKTLGFARGQDGRLELFLVGERIWSGRPLLSRHLEYDEWELVAEEAPLIATRLLLPNEPHFDPVAAWVCAELILNGVDRNVAAAFRDCEDLIELALERGSVGSETLLGLCGELLFLDALTRDMPQHAPSLTLDAWKGHERSTRDFQFGEMGVEVKTTTRDLSEHHIQGTHQVEKGLSVDGGPETDLRLLSIGISWLPPIDAGGFSLPAIVSAIGSRLAASEQEEFGHRVGRYLGLPSFAVDGDPTSLPVEFRRPFGVSFVRLYDLADPRIRLIDSSYLVDLHVVPESVSFSVRLPSSVNGTVNPLDGLPEVVRLLKGRLT